MGRTHISGFLLDYEEYALARNLKSGMGDEYPPEAFSFPHIKRQQP